MSGKFELKRTHERLFHFNLYACNGQTILQSEYYQSKASAINGINSIKRNALDKSRYTKYNSIGGRFYFSLKASNHQVIGQSQRYESEAGRNNGIESVMKNAPEAEIIDLT